MDILETFSTGLKEKSVISLAGAGGKTSTMYLLVMHIHAPQ